MKKTETPLSARERILQVAAELFYQQGYRATGINEVIRKADVAKATFYAHFPSKDDLCLAYLRESNVAEMAELTAFLDSRLTPWERFTGFMEAIEQWMLANNMRGCRFLNIVSEVPDPESPLRQEGMKHYDRLHALIEDMAEALVVSDKLRYGHLDTRRVADNYMVILTGAIGMAEIYHSIEPIERAKEAVLSLVGPP